MKTSSGRNTMTIIEIADHLDISLVEADYIIQIFYETKPHYEKLVAINNKLDGFHGVESIELSEELDHKFVGYYLNTGDTYNPTIVWDDINEKFLLTTWGDFYEEIEAGVQLEKDAMMADELKDLHRFSNSINYNNKGEKFHEFTLAEFLDDLASAMKRIPGDVYVTCGIDSNGYIEALQHIIDQIEDYTQEVK